MKVPCSYWKVMKVIIFACILAAAFIPQAQAFREKPEDVIEFTCGQDNIGGKKILLVYDTEHGATSTIAEAIGMLLCERGFQVDVFLARMVQDISPYDAVIIGTPIYYGGWLPGVKNFLKKYEQAIAAKPHLLFVNCTYLKEDTEEIRNKVMDLWVTPNLEKYPAIKPLDIGLFAGKILFEELYPLEFILMKLMKYEAGDFRDFDKINAWAESIALTLK